VALATTATRRNNAAILLDVGRSASALLRVVDMMRYGFFRREVETVLRVLGFTILVSAFATTFAWGYRQRQQAQVWREQACAYRLAEVTRRATFIGDDPGEACTRLQSLGLDMRVSGLPGIPGDFDVSRP
jgi:hypothetical protein